MRHRHALAALALAALLYGGPALHASPAGAEPLPPAAMTELDGLRTGQMNRLVFHKEPRERYDKPFSTKGGDELTYAAFEGKVVMVNFWATWCGPCRHEMPGIDRLQALLGGDDFHVAVISVDRGEMAKPLAFLEEIGAENLTPYHDPSGKLAVTHGAIGLPATIILDREGREIGRLTGPAEWDSPEAVALFERLIDLTGGGG